MLLDTTPLTSDGEDVVSFSRDMNADESTAPPAERVTNFFIADILSPNFGRKRCTKCAALPDVRIPRVGEWAERTPWKVHTYLGTSDIQLGLQTGTLPGNEDAVKEQSEWPAWVYCTRYSDRPTAGPRARKTHGKSKSVDEKRPRTAFTGEQISRLTAEFDTNRYLSEKRRRNLSVQLTLSESQIKIWFQNKRAKLKKTTGNLNDLAVKLRGQGLYNHTTKQQVRDFGIS